jgi:hypothetical protein
MLVSAFVGSRLKASNQATMHLSTKLLVILPVMTGLTIKRPGIGEAHPHVHIHAEYLRYGCAGVLDFIAITG